MYTPGHIEVYLSFDGNCLDALHFYRDVFGGEITYLQKWSDLPASERENMDDLAPLPEDAVMHANLKIGEVNIMASDNPYLATTYSNQITLNWSHPDAALVKCVFDALSHDGQIDMELEQTFFSPLFGHLTDAFGVNWQMLHWQENL